MSTFRSGFVRHQAKRLNRNLLLLNLGGLLLAAYIAYLNLDYLKQCTFGPIRLTESFLVRQTQLIDSTQFVSVSSNGIIADVLSESVKQRDRRTGLVRTNTTGRSYSAVAIGDHYLLVRHDYPLSGNEILSGTLAPIPQDVSATIDRTLQAEDMSFEALFFPVVLICHDYRLTAILLLIAFLPMVALNLWNLSKWYRREFTDVDHPIVQKITNTGALEVLNGEFDRTIQDENSWSEGRITITQHWLIAESVFDLTIVRISSITMAYKRRVWYNYTFLPVWYSSRLVLRTGTAGEIVLTASNRQCDLAIMHLFMRHPEAKFSQDGILYT